MSFKMKNFGQISYSMINWMSSVVESVTDFNIGSVTRTLLETVALELEELYWRTYNGLFDAQAEGVYTTFDFPRQPATKATGVVTFYRDVVDPDASYIPIGTQISTEGTEESAEIVFETQIAATLDTQTSHSDAITFITGTDTYFLSERQVYNVVGGIIVGINESGFVHNFIENTDFELITASSGSPAAIKWLAGGDSPKNNSSFTVNFQSLSVDVPVIALKAGTTGNISAEKLVLIKSPLSNVDGIINYEAFTSGTDLETDDERKARFASFIEGLSRGTLASLKYAAFNKTETYQVSSAVLLENVPGIPAGFVRMYIADSTGTASDEMIAEVIDAIEGYRGIGVIVQVESASRVNLDIACRLRIKEGYNKEAIRSNVRQALLDHLSRYTFPDDGPYSTLYLTNLDYISKGVRPDAVIEADIAFKRQADTWNVGATDDPFDPGYVRKIEDIKPTIDKDIAEIFRPGDIDVYIYYSAAGTPSDADGTDGDYYEDADSNNVYRKESGVWVQQ